MLLRIMLVLMVLGSGGVAAGKQAQPATVRIFPRGDIGAPTNTRVRFTFDRQDELQVLDIDVGSRQVRANGVTSASTARLSLRRDDGSLVPATVHRLPATARPVFILVPVAPLAAHTRYTATVRTADKDYAIDAFRTGAGADTTPPVLDRVDDLRFTPGRPVKRYGDPRGSWATMTMAGASDDRGIVSVEIYELPAGATAAKAADLRSVLVPGADHSVWLGDQGVYDPNFVFPAAGKAAPRHLRLGVRLIDLAGNASPIRIVDIDLEPRRHGR
jgi:hypothetical protein